MIVIYLFFLLFFLEGLARLPAGLTLPLYTLLPAGYFVEKSLRKEPIRLPDWKIFFAFLLFFSSLIVNYFFSVDKINTIDKILFYFVAFFIMIMAMNEQEKIKNVLLQTLIGLGLIFCFFSLNIVKLPTTSALQFFYPLYPNHNHLGDFLGLSILSALFIKLNKKPKTILLLILFLFFLFAFSRSAYIDLLAVLALLFWQRKDVLAEYRKAFFTIVIGIAIFFAFTQRQLHTIPLFKPVFTRVDQALKFTPRDILSSRPEYYHQGIRGFFDKPLFGWGEGNYIYPSNKYVSAPLDEVRSALNLFLTNLTELGIVGFIPYILVIGLLLYCAYKNRRADPSFFLALYLLLNFQTDYTYSITGFYLLLFLFLGLGLKEGMRKYQHGIFTVLSLLLTIFIWLQITGQILNLTRQYRLAKLIFPWQHQPWQALITQDLKNNKLAKAKMLANEYEQLSPISLPSLDYLTGFYAKINNVGAASRLLDTFKNTWRYPPYNMLTRLYAIEKNIQGTEQADKYFMHFYPQLKQSFYLSKQFEDQVYKFCQDQEIAGCRFKYFYEPKPYELRYPNPQIPFNKVVNRMNNDGFNSMENYTVQKTRGLFRIMVLGGSETYGLYIKTQDNWPEQLQTMLNKQKICPNIQKFEVINLGVDGYDLSYSVERYLLKGKKYKPDLILLFIANPYQLDDPLIEKSIQYDEQKALNPAYAKEVAKGNEYPAWTLGMQDVIKEKSRDEILKEQKSYLEQLIRSNNNALWILSYNYLSAADQDYFQQFLKNQKNSNFVLFNSMYNQKQYLFPDGNLNSSGHKILAQQIYNKIIGKANICTKQ